MSKHYRLPSVITDSWGAQRRAGFEFEFGNLPIVDTAKALQKSLGGELDMKSPFEAVGKAQDRARRQHTEIKAVSQFAGVTGGQVFTGLDSARYRDEYRQREPRPYSL